MFSASMENPRLLRDSIDMIAQLIDEATIRIKPDGFEMIAADRAMVAVVDFKLSKNAFLDYQCDTMSEIGLNLNNLLTVLKRGENDKINLKLDENKLNISFTGASTRNFSIPLLEIASREVPPISQFEFPALAEINTDILNSGIEDANTIADSVIFEIDPENFVMKSETDASKTELNLKKDSPSLIHLSSPGAVKSRFPLEVNQSL